jgi:hypothetical protein
MRFTDGTRRARIAFAFDLLAIVAFVVLGMREHRSGSTVVVFARTAVPVMVAWLACGVAFRTYRPPSPRSLVKTILVAVPVGILVRTAIVGSPKGWGILTFLGVALAFLSLLVGTARIAASLLSRRFEAEIV